MHNYFNILMFWRFSQGLFINDVIWYNALALTNYFKSWQKLIMEVLVDFRMKKCQQNKKFELNIANAKIDALNSKFYEKI